MYDVTVFIGRMQPFHLGHLQVVRQALEQSKLLVIVLGNPDAPRTPRNLLDFDERMKVIRAALTPEQNINVRITGVNDHAYNMDAWLGEVQTNVNEMIGGYLNPSIALIGHSKDHTSYYLKNFPHWDSIEVENYKNLNATQIREEFYWNDGLTQKGQFNKWLYDAVHPSTIELFKNWAAQPWWAEVMREREFLLRHNAMWKNTPYSVSFQTVDAVVKAAGHVLMIQRRAAPGKGLWALPGGYLAVEKHETLREACLRELYEETKISLPVRTLEKSIVGEKTYDAPNRSERGRIISQIFLFDLDAVEGSGKIRLPKIKGSDDAAKAKWIPLSKLKTMRKEVFEDHFSIIEDQLEFTVEFKNGFEIVG